MVYTPGWRTPKMAIAGGCSVLCRDHMDVAFPIGMDMDVYPGRVVGYAIRYKHVGITIVYSVYLRVGEGLSPANIEILAQLFAHAHAHGHPWMAAGDWNMDPEELRPVFAEAPTPICIIANEVGTCKAS